MSAPESIVLAHLSDVHLSPVSGLTPRHWNIKRLLGFLNWHGSRAYIHRRTVADALVNDIKAHSPDHIAVTGDLANLGLPTELKAAHAWLSELGPETHVTAIPGNHDIYVKMTRDIGVARWAGYMTSDIPGTALLIAAHSANPDMAIEPATGSATDTQISFPFCRRIGPIALIALNSAVPTPLFNASGYLGELQLAKLGATLDEARRQSLVRVVIIHHPPLPGQTPKRRALRDARQLEKTLATHGAELVLHGHNHRDSIAWVEGTNHRFPVIGIASASAAIKHHDEPLARYNLIQICRGKSTVRIGITGRGLTTPDGPVSDVSLNSFEVRLPEPV